MSQFYTSSPMDCLRLGDVVSGFPIATPKSDRLVEGEGTPRNLIISVDQPKYLVVMTPCCSIEKGAVVLAPLGKLHHGFFKNPHFTEDFTRLNRKVAPENSLPPFAWEQLSSEEKAAKLNEGAGYAFRDYFVYEPHDFLPPYRVKKEKAEWETRYYIVDFKTMYRFECNMIRRENQNTPVPEGCNKLLQLTVVARNELRDKFTDLFSRIPEEDRGELL